jgi:type VI secretion system protein ImpC
MSDDRFHTRVELDVGLGRETASASPRPDTPFRIALLGDFSGRASRGVVETGEALASRRPALVDRDNFDEVLAQMAPELEIDVAAGDTTRIRVRFGELEDFHPDRLYERLPLFRSLADAPPGPTMPDPATEHRRSEPPHGTPELKGGGGPSTRGLLEQIVEESSAVSQLTPSGDDLHAFIERAMAPHLVPNPDPQQTELRARVAAAAGMRMRGILHHPDFQALEALWRAAFFLVRRVETDARLQLYLVDVSKGELAADLSSDRRIEATGVYDLLTRGAAGPFGSGPWSLLTGNYTFGDAPEDVFLLSRLAAVSMAAGAPLISAAAPRLAGFTRFDRTPDPADWSPPGDPEWDALRRTREACFVGLALPRFLLRLPYGKQTEPCERFEFEEVGEIPAHGDYLWGNPAIACALLLAQAFESSGWRLRPTRLEIEDLPLHLVRSDGSVAAKPCAEALLPERVAERILECGIMPLASIKDRDAVRLVRFQSLASPLAPLAGRWRTVDDVADLRE